MKALIIAIAAILVAVVFMTGCQSERDMVPDIPNRAEDRPRYVITNVYVKFRLIQNNLRIPGLLETNLLKLVSECDLYDNDLRGKISLKAEVLESDAENINIVGDVVSFWDVVVISLFG